VARSWHILRSRDVAATLESELAAAPEVNRVEGLGKDLDIVQAFFTRKSQLERELVRLRGATGKGGILWLCGPTGGGINQPALAVIRTTSAKAVRPLASFRTAASRRVRIPAARAS
jgi:hypothetical protein